MAQNGKTTEPTQIELVSWFLQAATLSYTLWAPWMQQLVRISEQQPTQSSSEAPKQGVREQEGEEGHRGAAW